MPKKKEELFHYILMIKKGNLQLIDYLSFLLCFISWIFFLYYSFNLGSISTLLFWMSWVVPIALAWKIWVKIKINRASTYKHPLFITGCAWLLVPGWRWVALFFIVFILFDHQSRHPLEIGVSDDQVVINTFFRKRYHWKEFSNLVLKDNLLTLDFKNNKIIQKEIMWQDVNEKEFNAFCNEQLWGNSTLM